MNEPITPERIAELRFIANNHAKDGWPVGLRLTECLDAYTHLKAERDALLADKERLDWLEQNNVRINKDAKHKPYSAEVSASGHYIRSAIDEAMKSATGGGK